MSHQDPLELLTGIARILKAMRIPYIVSGGMAVLIWGRPRFTADIDIVIELQRKDIEEFEWALKALGRKGFIDKDTIIEALSTQGEFNFIDGTTGVKVDFWILKDSAFDISRIKRKIKKTILGETIWFSSPEDLILIKADWYRESQSSRQIEDIESIFSISGDILDRKYITRWAEVLGVSDILKKFW